LWQKDVAEFSAVEIEAVVDRIDDGELIEFSNFCHGSSVVDAEESTSVVLVCIFS
jgi:hypothetical protein